MKRIKASLCAVFVLFLSQTAASSGLLFNVSATGTPANLSITLCLNGNGPLSCQNYTVSALNLSISTTIPNHVYPAIGIKVNTPGYVLAGCTPTANGYCLFSANSTTSTSIAVSSTSAFSVGGAVSGLSGTVVLQNNGGDSQTLSSNGPFTFSTPVTTGEPYAVTVLTQPADQTCTVSNGSGTIGSSDVTDVGVSCATNNTIITVSSNGTIPVNGAPGSLTVTNTGTTYDAYNVSASLPSGWTGVTQDATGCTAISPNGGTCTLTFISTTPYVAQGSITVTGDNITSPPTTALAFSLSGYLVWSIDSSTIAEVIDTSDLTSTQWGNNVVTNAQSLINGISNTSTIDGTSGIGTSAAVNCYNSTSGGVSTGTWYLPAICQMGGAGQGAGCSSGLANIDTNLVQLGFSGLSGSYWSSTEYSGGPTFFAWFENFASGSGSNQDIDVKDNPFSVRCARAFTY
jgi:hypothetical protein